MNSEPTEYGRIGAKGRLTIPKAVREELGLEEGDRVMISVSGGRLEVVPMTLVPRDQAWFYRPEVQRRVAEAEADVADGRATTVSSARQALERLDRLERGGEAAE